jgi:hypothetical protein
MSTEVPASTGEPPTNNSVSADTKACRYCGSPIILTAILCPVCKSCQNRFRNQTNYLAGIAGFIALVISASTFTYGRLSDIIKEKSWYDRIGVAYLEYPGLAVNGEVLLINSGDGDVLITDVEMAFDVGNMAVPINATVSKGSATDIPLKFFERIWVSSTPVAASFIWNDSGTVSKAEAFSRRNDRCIFLKFITIRDPSVIRMNEFYKSHGARLATVQIKAYLNAFSVHTGDPFVVPISDGAFLVSPSPGCANPNRFIDRATEPSAQPASGKSATQ